MNHRLAVISLILSDRNSADAVNELLHNHGDIIIGRFGLPCPKFEKNVITVVVDAPQPIISGLSGKLGRIKNVVAKVTYAPDNAQ